MFFVISKYDEEAMLIPKSGEGRNKTPLILHSFFSMEKVQVIYVIEENPHVHVHVAIENDYK